MIEVGKIINILSLFFLFVVRSVNIRLSKNFLSRSTYKAHNKKVNFHGIY